MSRKIHPSTKCLNCGAVLTGKFCSQCGQDNLDHQETVWHLLQHFFGDITHYDSNFWKTIQPLLSRPGFLTQEYLIGRRASYLNPVRMFIFLNFIFFLLLAWLPQINVRPSQNSHTNIYLNPKAPKKPIVHSIKDQAAAAENRSDDIVTITVNGDSAGGINYNSIAEYDSAQNTLPPLKRDGRLKKKFKEVMINTILKTKTNDRFFEDNFRELFLHNAAKLTFLFLIVCSCLLYIFYYRKHILMINHALFTIHLCCSFLLLFVCMLFLSYIPYAGGYLEFALILYGGYYFYKALRNVYGQSFLKTSFKFLAINLILLIIMSLALAANALFTLFSMNG